jgi:hypothetical protein
MGIEGRTTHKSLWFLNTSGISRLPMTARETLNRRMPWFRITVFSGVAAALLGFLLYSALGNWPFLLVAISGMIVSAWASEYARLVLKCPWCDGNLVPLIFNRAGIAMGRRVRFCPYCGTNFDDELEETAAPVNEQT